MVTACGISLGAGEEETEIFKGLAIEGDFRPGGTLTLTLEHARQYPVPVRVKCVLLAVDPRSTPTPESTPTATSTPKGRRTPTPTATSTPEKRQAPTPTSVPIPRARPTIANKVRDILAKTLPANRKGGPVGEATPVVGTTKKNFSAPKRPGRYVVQCFTPKDRNNAISKSISIVPAATPTP